MAEQDQQNVSSESTPSPSDSESLTEMVRKQVEYYFSKENLQSDPFLTSQMDSNNSVPISIVMQFAKLKSLTQDEELVKKSLESSKIVSVFEDRIRCNIKPGGRNTIILRDISADIPEDEVREIFKYDSCKPIVSLRSDIENTWFVVFESEQDAKDTILDLKLKKRTFRGESVKARLKSETITRSFYMLPAPPIPAQFPPMGYTPYMQVPPMYPAYPGKVGSIPLAGAVIPPVQVVNGAVKSPRIEVLETEGDASTKQQPSSPRSAPHSPPGKSDRKQHSSGGKDSSGHSSTQANSGRNTSSAGRDNRERKPNSLNTGSHGSNSTSSNQRSSNQNKDSNSSSNTTNRRSSARNRDYSYSHDQKRNESTQNNNNNSSNNNNQNIKSIAVDSTNFPPLSLPDAGPIPTPGYKGEFLMYSYDAITNIVKDIRSTVLPAQIRPEDHPLAMDASPNLDLLKRQRTFSIDETRDQLQQGRPVQREAVLGGAVDYASMMYGDGYQPPATEAVGVADAKKAGAKPAVGSWAGILMSGVASGASTEGTLIPPKHPSSSANTHKRGTAQSTTGADKSGHKGGAHKDGGGAGRGQQDTGKPREARRDGNHGRKGGREGKEKEKDGDNAAKKGKPHNDAAASVSGADEAPEKAVSVEAGEPSVISSGPSIEAKDPKEGGTDSETDSMREKSKNNNNIESKRQVKHEKTGTVGGNNNSNPKREKKDRNENSGSDSKHSHPKDASAASSHPEVGAAGPNEKESPALPAPTSWGGKPTFANILKQKQAEGDATGAAATSGDKDKRSNGPSSMEVLEKQE